MHRRTFLRLIGVLSLSPAVVIRDVWARTVDANRSLLEAPLEIAGSWKSSPPDAVTRVLMRMREVCLSGLQLVSDRQPDKVRVDNHADGSPAIWLHQDQPGTAWIIVNIGPLDWCKLAYQFGHELGHVLCNSWTALSKPRPPSQWLEEAMVEAFSVRGLGLLAASWETNPPFAGDAAFAAAIRQYRRNLIVKYQKDDGQQPARESIAEWFHAYRNRLEAAGSTPVGSAVLAILNEMERDKACVEDLGAVNRWPARSGVPSRNT